MDQDKPLKPMEPPIKKGEDRYLGKKADYPNLPKVGWIINDNCGNKYEITKAMQRQRWIIRLKKREEP